MRRVAALSFVVLLGACGAGDDAAPSAAGDPVANTIPAPDLASAERSIDDTDRVDEQIGEQVGEEIDEGADEPDAYDQFDLLRDWLDAEHDEMTSGSGISGLGSSYAVSFSVNVQTAQEAADACAIYGLGVERFMGNYEVDSITLKGWVLSESGAYVDADWGSIECG